MEPNVQQQDNNQQVAPKPGEQQVAPPAVNETWLNKVPETLRGHKSLAKFKDEGAIAQAYVNLEGMLGNRIALPGKDAKPEEVRAFYTKLGVPEKPEGYTEHLKDFKRPENWDGEMEGRFLKTAHELGVTPAQAKRLMEFHTQEMQGAMDRYTTTSNEAKAQAWDVLKEKWGAATERNVSLAQRVISEYGGPDLVAALEEKGLGNDPRLLEFLAQVGESMLEDGLIKADNLGKGKEDAQAEYDAILKNPAYFDAKHPDHAKLVEKARDLLKIALGV